MKIVITLLTALLTFICLANTALAGDSVSIRVSCTIPSIPGVNAPALSEEKPQKETAPQPRQRAEEQRTEQPTIIVQEQSTVRTVYTR